MTAVLQQHIRSISCHIEASALKGRFLLTYIIYNAPLFPIFLGVVCLTALYFSCDVAYADSFPNSENGEAGGRLQDLTPSAEKSDASDAQKKTTDKPLTGRKAKGYKHSYGECFCVFLGSWAGGFCLLYIISKIF